MSERRKQLEAEGALTPVTPTKRKVPDIYDWTPVKIRGKRTPLKAGTVNPWARTPDNNVAQRSRAMSVPPQPLKSILKTPERRKEAEERNKSLNKLYSSTSISWRGDTKKGAY